HLELDVRPQRRRHQQHPALAAPDRRLPRLPRPGPVADRGADRDRPGLADHPAVGADHPGRAAGDPARPVRGRPGGRGRGLVGLPPGHAAAHPARHRGRRGAGHRAVAERVRPGLRHERQRAAGVIADAADLHHHLPGPQLRQRLRAVADGHRGHRAAVGGRAGAHLPAGGSLMTRRPVRWLGRTLTLVIILLWSLFPLYWALNTSLSTLSAAESKPVHYLPTPLELGNYQQLFGIAGSRSGFATEFGRSLLNGAIESGGAMVLTIVIAVLAAYAFARMNFMFKRVIFVSVLATLLLPAYATLIPLYRIMSSFGLINTYIAVILVYTSGFLPLATWILYNYFNSIPRSLEEAAFVDGASWLGTLIRVVVPVALPGIAAAAIITFLLGWAQFLFPLVLTSDLSAQPVTVVVAALNGQRIVPFTLLMACGVLAAAVPG